MLYKTDDKSIIVNMKKNGIEEIILLYRDGSINTKFYKLRGLLHREDGPASISYYPDGLISLEEYYRHGSLHRRDGAAIISYSKLGKINDEIFQVTSYLGVGKNGFWALWDLLDENERMHPNVVWTMARYI
jgi:hypothetical protein